MERLKLDQVSSDQRDAAAYWYDNTSGDDEVLEDLGMVTSVESLLDQATSGAEVAALLGNNILPVEPTAAETARSKAHQYYAAEFSLTGVTEVSARQRATNAQGVALARSLLEQRRAS